MEEMASRKPAGHTQRAGRTKRTGYPSAGMTCCGPGLLHGRCGHRSRGEESCIRIRPQATSIAVSIFCSEARQHTCSNCCLGRSSGRLRWARRERATRLTGYAGPPRRPGCRRDQLMLGSADVFSR